MAGPRRATIESAVAETVTLMVTNASAYIDLSEFHVRIVERDIEKLACADAVSASFQRAMLVHLAGDLTGALYWLNNIKRLRPDFREMADATEAVILSNLGYFSQSAQKLAPLDATRRAVNANILYAAAALNELVELEGEYQESELPDVANFIQSARELLMTLQQIGVGQPQVQAMLDVAGEVMREHRILFLEEGPIVRSGGDCVLYQFLIRGDHSLALRLTDEVLLKLVERDLDASGLSFSFVAA